MLFESEFNNISKRYVSVSEHKYSVWAYLTFSNENKIEKDCWLFNTIIAPTKIIKPKSKSYPPPATVEFVKNDNLNSELSNKKIRFKWSSDGESVLILFGRKPIGFIYKNEKYGFSKNLLKSGAFGNVWDEDLYKELFEK